MRFSIFDENDEDEDLDKISDVSINENIFPFSLFLSSLSLDGDNTVVLITDDSDVESNNCMVDVGMIACREYLDTVLQGRDGSELESGELFNRFSFPSLTFVLSEVSIKGVVVEKSDDNDDDDNDDDDVNKDGEIGTFS